MQAGQRSGHPSFAIHIGALAVVAAATVGFAVGDVLAAPGVQAATIAQRSERGDADYEWTWVLAPGKTLEIQGVNGEVRATGGTGRGVEVRAWKHGRRSDPERVTVEVLRHDGGVTLCVRYPGEGNRCEPGGGSRMNLRRNDVEVNFEVRVPAGVRLVARTVNGAVVARDLEGDVEGHTVNGAVTLETRGRARARTVDGEVRVTLGRLDGAEPLEFHTVNGGITVILPDDAAARVEAKTVHGNIESDFPITVTRVRGRLVGDRLEGTIGRGGPLLELETVNGAIRLRRARSL